MEKHRYAVPSLKEHLKSNASLNYIGARVKDITIIVIITTTTTTTTTSGISIIKTKRFSILKESLGFPQISCSTPSVA